MQSRPFLPQNNMLPIDNIFVRKDEKMISPTSSDLPSKLGTDNPNVFSDTSSQMPVNPYMNMSPTSDSQFKNDMYSTTSQNLMPNNPNMMFSATSNNSIPNNNMMFSATSNNSVPNNNMMFSATSNDLMPNNNMMLSATSEASPAFQRNVDPRTFVSQNKFDWKKDILYFSQIDMDIAWMDKKNDSNSLLFGDLADFFGVGGNKQPLPVVCDFKKAVDVAHKICKYSFFVNDAKKRDVFAKEKQIPNVIMSSVEKDKYTYPLFGSVIFGLKFKQEPTIKDLGTIDRSKYNLLSENSTYDIVFYNAQWNEKDHGKTRAVIYNLNKVDITDIYLKCFDCAVGGTKGMAILKILNTSSQESRFSSKYVNLLEYLYKNGHVNLKEYESKKQQ